eukprot:Sdes_comp20851_c0_seq2m17609
MNILKQVNEDIRLVALFDFARLTHPHRVPHFMYRTAIESATKVDNPLMWNYIKQLYQESCQLEDVLISVNGKDSSKSFVFSFKKDLQTRLSQQQSIKNNIISTSGDSIALFPSLHQAALKYDPEFASQLLGRVQQDIEDLSGQLNQIENICTHCPVPHVHIDPPFVEFQHSPVVFEAKKQRAAFLLETKLKFKRENFPDSNISEQEEKLKMIKESKFEDDAYKEPAIDENEKHSILASLRSEDTKKAFITLIQDAGSYLETVKKS